MPITRTSTVLLEGLKDSSSAAHWREFDARYRPLLLAVARRLGLNPVDAEDAAQETLAAFLLGYRHGDYQRQRGRLRDWLAGIMTHKVRDLQRKIHRQQTLVAVASDETSLDSLADPAVQEAIEREWAHAVLRQAIDEVRSEVAPQTMESFELYTLQQWPAEQVARRLSVSVDVVYQSKARILKRIRELLPELEKSW